MPSNPLTKGELELADAFEAFVRKRYVIRADARQKEMGLSYVEMETRDLAVTMARFITHYNSRKNLKKKIYIGRVVKR